MSRKYTSKLLAERAEELKKQAESEGPNAKLKRANKQPLKVFREGVGKYLNLQEVSTGAKSMKVQEVSAKKPKKDTNYKFGAFDSW